MTPTEIQFQREMLAYGVNIALAKREIKLAEQRHADLEFDCAKFQLDFFEAQLHAAETPISPQTGAQQ